MRQNKPNKEMEAVIVKTVASFLNAESGGTLLVGVDNSGDVLGLQHDYKTLGRKQDRDGFENFLTTLLLDAYGKDSSPLIRITFHEVDSKEVCRVVAKPSPKPVYVKDERGEHLYIRAGNSTRLLSTREAIEYCKLRWN
jgi:predicted HTH transcriptional regulator